MADKYITEYSEETSPASTSAILIDEGAGAYKYVQLANIVKANTLTGTTLASNVVTSSLTTVGALNAGSITSGFGNINNGTSTLTTGALSATTGTFSGKVSAFKTGLGSASYQTRTISSGTVAVSDTYGIIGLVGEGSVADDLDNITGAVAGEEVEIMQHGGGGAVTVKHSGSLRLKGGVDATLVISPYSTLIKLRYNGTFWYELYRNF